MKARLGPLILFLIFGFPASSNDQQQYDWADHPPSSSALKNALDQIWMLSLESEPFAAIRSEPDPAHSPMSWLANKSLPGAKVCHVYDLGGNIQFAGTEIPLPVYECAMTVRPGTTQGAYRNLVRRLRAVMVGAHAVQKNTQSFYGRQGILNDLPPMVKDIRGEVFLTLKSDDKEAKRFPRTSCFQARYIDIFWAETTVEKGSTDARLLVRISPPSTQHPAVPGDCLVLIPPVRKPHP